VTRLDPAGAEAGDIVRRAGLHVFRFCALRLGHLWRRPGEAALFDRRRGLCRLYGHGDDSRSRTFDFTLTVRGSHTGAISYCSSCLAEPLRERRFPALSGAALRAVLRNRSRELGH